MTLEFKKSQNKRRWQVIENSRIEETRAMVLLHQIIVNRLNLSITGVQEKVPSALKKTGLWWVDIAYDLNQTSTVI